MDNSPVLDVHTEANPAAASSVHNSVEKDTEVEIIGSQFVERTDASNVLAKVTAYVKPASSSKVSVPDTGSLENLDFSSLLQEFSQNRLREDGIVVMLKKKNEALDSSSQKEIANLKNLLAHEAVKAEESKKKQIDSEKTVIDAISNLSKREHEFAEKEKVLLARAKKAEHDLETLRKGYENAMEILNRMITCFFGQKHDNNLELPKQKLKALFIFVKQLYVGGGECIKLVRGWDIAPPKLHDFLVELSNVPQWIQGHKMSSCRRGAMRVMALAKAYFLELKLDLLARGFLMALFLT